jgi:hypothetical protein
MGHMDLWKYINELHEEKQRLDRLIESLESLQSHQRTPSTARARRGRKPGMPDEERKLVSERMKRYWAERRHGKVAEPDEPMTHAASAGSI